MSESNTTVSNLGYLSFNPRCIPHNIGHTDDETRQYFERALERAAVVYLTHDEISRYLLKKCIERFGIGKVIFPLDFENFVRTTILPHDFGLVTDARTLFLSYGLLEFRVPFKIMYYNGGKPIPYFYNFTKIALAVLSKFS